MGGLPCADSGGSVAIRDSTAAAQILRMDHSLMGLGGMDNDFYLNSGAARKGSQENSRRPFDSSFLRRFWRRNAPEPASEGFISACRLIVMNSMLIQL